jgi:1-acyl-sn-glycerol-3-phosphate acyltransferase
LPAVYEAHRILLAPLVRALYRLEVRGAEYVPAAGPLVVVANHESVLDPFVLGTAIPRPLRFVGKSELWRIPLVAPWLGALGAISVARGESDTAAVAEAVAALERGEVVALFPEGGVRRPGSWLRGAARMALAAGAPVLPVRLVDVRRAVGRWELGFPRLAVLIGEPIGVEQAKPTVVAARELTRRAQAAVAALGS